jgi:ATP-dependent Lon protease
VRILHGFRALMERRMSYLDLDLHYEPDWIFSEEEDPGEGEQETPVEESAGEEVHIEPRETADVDGEDIEIPEELPILPLRGMVVYPETAVPLLVGQPRSVRLIDEVVGGDRLIGLVASQMPELEEPSPDQIYTVGTAAAVHRLFRAPDGTIRLLVQGLTRIRVEEYTATEPYLKARVSLIPEEVEETLEVEALMRNIGDQFRRLSELVPSIPSELLGTALNVEDPLQFVYTVATYMRMELDEASSFSK